MLIEAAMHFGMVMEKKRAKLYCQPSSNITITIYHPLQQNKVDILGMESKIFPNLGPDYFFITCFPFIYHYLVIPTFYSFHCLNLSPVS